jgi:hypothetical protein
MATIKNIPDSYTINVPVMTVNGNLYVTGNTSIIESTNTSIYDNNIVLNAGLSPSTPPTLNAGITVDRGTQSNVLIQWTESTKSWQITNDGTNYGNLLYSPNGNVTLSANLYLQTTTTTPPAIAGYSGLYAKTANSGGSGLYVSNNEYTNEELAIKRRSIAYSIIFG